MSDRDTARECAELINRFAQYADTGEYELLGELFLEDAHFIRRGETYIGRSAIVAAVDGMLQNRKSAPRNPGWRVRHVCTNISITPLTDTQADGRAYYQIYRYQGEPVEGPAPVNGPALIGDYADRYVRTAEGWRIAKREIHPAFYVPGA